MTRSWQAWQAAAVLMTVVAPSCVDAAWLGYKNEAQTVIVVQSASMVNNQIRLGKAHVLYPGEIAWDAVTAPGWRRLSVHDPKQNNRLLLTDLVNCQALDIFLSVQQFTPPPVKGQVQPAQLKFVQTKAPVMPGVNVPGTNPNPPPTVPPGAPKAPANPPKPTMPPPPSTPPATPKGAGR